MNNFDMLHLVLFLWGLLGWIDAIGVALGRRSIGRERVKR